MMHRLYAMSDKRKTSHRIKATQWNVVLDGGNQLVYINGALCEMCPVSKEGLWIISYVLKFGNDYMHEQKHPNIW